MVWTDDEYDVFYDPLDPEEINLMCAIDSKTKVVPGTATELEHGNFAHEDAELGQVSQESMLTALDAEDDVFDVYDLSEFTAEDFAQIDAVVQLRTASSSVSESAPQPDPSIHAEGVGRTSGGPGIGIEIEQSSADSSALPKAPLPTISSQLKPSRELTPDEHSHERNASKAEYDTRSPFERFRSWNKLFSVTDLVGPAWCEVQFDYGLRQKRWLKPEERPTSFVTSEGKTITVDKRVVEENHGVVTRGKSVHKVLEREIHPEMISVMITTQEERWGVRLVNMLASVYSLAQIGCCREMPVFGIVHDQVVVGIIDELVRTPVSTEVQVLPTKRSPRKRGSPSTPSKKSPKKNRKSPEPSQPTLASFFHTAVPVLDAEAADGDTPPGEPPSTPRTPRKRSDNIGDERSTTTVCTYTLHISDTKTRRVSRLPGHEDTLSSRLQLMLYHRLLSSLIASPHKSDSKSNTSDGESRQRAVEPLDFAALWERVGVNPTKRFSTIFMRDSGLLGTSGRSPRSQKNRPGGALECLDDLVAAWRHAVDVTGLRNVDPGLKLVYRLQPSKAGSQAYPLRRRKPTVDAPGYFADQEAEDLAKAIEASLNEAPRLFNGEDDALARAIAQSLEESQKAGVQTVSEAMDEDSTRTEVVPTRENSEALEDDKDESIDVDALQSLSREDASTAIVVEDETPAASTPQEEDEDTPMLSEELEVKARIIGSKEFTVDDEMLNGYLDSVLNWWHGRRPPQGVDVELTRRCLSCEYLEGCEWREKKAAEAQSRLAEKLGYW